MSCGAWQSAPPNYACSYTVTGTETEGTTEISIGALDAAGNMGFGSGSVEFDFTGPALQLSVQPTGRPARLGELVTVGVAANEALNPAGIALDSGALNLGTPSGSGTSYSWTYTVKDTDSGTFNLSATAADAVGNLAAAPATGTILLDGIAPTLSNVSADRAKYSRVAGFDTVTLTFDCTEDVGSGLGVTVGGAAMSCGAWQTQSPSYACTYTVQSGDTGGVKSIEIKATDAAGNSAYGSGSVEYDFTGPAVISAGPGQGAYKLNDSVLYTVNVSEPLSGDPARPVVKVFKDGVEQAGFFGDPVSETDTSFTYSKPVVSGTDGSYTVTVDGTDKAGNAATGLSGTGWKVDAALPVVTPVSLTTNNPNFNTMAKDADTVTAVFTTNEDPPQNPSVVLGGKAMAFASKTGTGPYTFTYNYTVATGDGDGAKTATATATDAAGNVTVQDIGGVTYDFAPPEAALEAAPASARVGTTVRVTLTGTEPISGPPPLEAKNGGSTAAFVAQDSTAWKLSYSYAYVVTGGTAAGVHTMQPFSVTDQAGNSRVVTPSPAVTFSVDPTIPAIVGTPTLNKSPASYKAGDVILLSFTTTEDLDGSLPKVTLNTGTPKDLPCAAGAGVNDYTCTLAAPLTGTESPQGLTGISIELADPAGNVGFASTTLTLDFAAPFVISAKPAQPSYKLNDTILYSVNVSEPLSGSPGRPALSVRKGGVEQPGFFGTPVTETDSSFTYSAPVLGGMDGSYTVEVALTDKAGNSTASISGDPFAVDATPPVVTEQALVTNNANGSALAKDGDTVTAVFTMDEMPLQNPAATLGGKPMAFGSKTGTGPYTFTYTRAAAAADGDGVKGVTVTTSDTAGNVAVFGFTGAVTYDFTKPGIATGSEGLQLVPFTGSLLPAVTKVTLGTTARVSFTTTEPLLMDPVLTLSPSAGTWSVTKFSSAGSSYIFDIKPTGGSPTQGATNVNATLTDKAGNVSDPIVLSLPAPGIDVDTIAPAPMTIEQSDRIEYRRIPWGSDATAGIKRFSVKTVASCGPGTDAVEPNATVIFWDGADTTTASEIGRATADANGCFAEKEINRADRVHVFAAQVDAAGNLDSATASEIKNHEWIATMGYKVAGDTFDNPHHYETRGLFAPQLVQSGEEGVSEVGAGSGLNTRGGGAAHAVGMTRWSDQAFGSSPAARSSHAMAYDSARSRVVLFGGWDGVSYKSDTWEWDGAKWTQSPATGPTARSGHAMAYDSSRGKVILFGGWDGVSSHNETWEWDGATWTQVASTGPSVRSGHVMAYDSARRKTVLFGGKYYSSGYEYVGDTWEWDGSSWTQVSSTGPSARGGSVMAFDSSQNRVIMFGGDDGTVYYGDTWKWDGTTWTQVSSTGPSARSGSAMAYDSARAKTIIFGGYAPATGYKGDTWEWNGATWTDKGAFGPPSGSGHAMAYDSARDKVVLFVLRGFVGPTAETWAWNGTTWTQRDSTGPSLRSGHAMAYDSTYKKTVLFGGFDGSWKGDTWEWNGPGWTKPSAVFPPSARESHAMAFDSVRNWTVMFGGLGYGDTWSWSFGWTQRAAVGPSVRDGHAMAYDSARDKVVLFGGTGATGLTNDTWEWNGTSWTQVASTGPSARSSHAMAYDSARGKTVLFGGYSGVREGDTWEWDGTSWTQVASTGPSLRSGHAMAYDTARGTTVLFGGSDDIGAQGDTWEWDGATWTQVVSSAPSPRYRHAIVYDMARSRIVLFGGYDGGVYKTGTWEWDDGVQSRAGQVMGAAFSSAGVVSDATLTSISVSVYTGGVGYPAGVATNGVNLQVWDEGMWKTVATNNSPPDNPQLVMWSTDTDPYWSNLKATDPAAFQNNVGRLFFSDQQTLNFAVTPVAPNGTGTGEVSVDYVEVVVKYRQP
jgi:hypothetical protein